MRNRIQRPFHSGDSVPPVAASGADVERGELDGIPVFWASAPEPVSAALIFRVGRADETLPTAGITHLVEHLALFTRGISPFETNGAVDNLRTVFFARGTREEVLGFLTAVAQSIQALPMDRLEDEKRVLETEAATRPSSTYETVVGLRFGASRHGLLNYAELGLRAASAESVVHWAAERFSRENAAIWMSGPPPDELELNLSAGRRLSPPDPEPLPKLRLPAQASFGNAGVALGALAERSTALTTGLGVALERAHAHLRLTHGLTYGVYTSYEPLTAVLAHVFIAADALAEHARAVRDELLAVLEDLAAEGLSADDLEGAKKRAARALTDPLGLPQHLDRAATNELFGGQFLTKGELLAELDELTSEMIAEALAVILETAIFLVPEGLAPPGRFSKYGDWDVPRVQGREYRLSGSGRQRQSTRVITGRDGISLVPPQPEEPITILYGDAAAVLRWRRGRRTLLGRDGSWFEIEAATIVDGDRLVSAIDSLFDSSLFISMEDVDDAGAYEDLVDEKLRSRKGLKDEIAAFPQYLLPGEKPLILAEASKGSREGLLAVTDRRVLFLCTGRARGDKLDLDAYPYEEINNAEAEQGSLALRRAKLTLNTRAGEIAFSRVTPRERAEEMASEILGRLAPRRDG
jgi:zinc protease